MKGRVKQGFALYPNETFWNETSHIRDEVGLQFFLCEIGDHLVTWKVADFHLHYIRLLFFFFQQKVILLFPSNQPWLFNNNKFIGFPEVFLKLRRLVTSVQWITNLTLVFLVSLLRSLAFTRPLPINLQIWLTESLQF